MMCDLLVILQWTRHQKVLFFLIFVTIQGREALLYIMLLVVEMLSVVRYFLSYYMVTIAKEIQSASSLNFE